VLGWLAAWVCLGGVRAQCVQADAPVVVLAGLLCLADGGVRSAPGGGVIFHATLYTRAPVEHSLGNIQGGA
jgi:hypothetical protein